MKKQLEPVKTPDKKSQKTRYATGYDMQRGATIFQKYKILFKEFEKSDDGQRLKLKISVPVQTTDEQLLYQQCLSDYEKAKTDPKLLVYPPPPSTETDIISGVIQMCFNEIFGRPFKVLGEIVDFYPSESDRENYVYWLTFDVE